MNTISIYIEQEVEVAKDAVMDSIEIADFIEHHGEDNIISEIEIETVANKVEMEYYVGEVDQKELLGFVDEKILTDFVREHAGELDMPTDVEMDPIRSIDEIFDESIKDDVSVRNHLKERFMKEFKQEIISEIVTKIMNT